jgi:methyl-accepting chemotaxis protein
MTQLAELDAAVRELNELWQVCTDDHQCQQLLEKRDALDTQARELGRRIIQEGNAQLADAVGALNDLTESARSAKSEVDDVAQKIAKTSDVIDKAAKAIGKLAALLT